MENINVKVFDVIQIIESMYKPEHPIGNKYVVVELLDGLDVAIINEHGKYDVVCWEDYKVIGNVDELKEEFWGEYNRRR